MDLRCLITLILLFCSYKSYGVELSFSGNITAETHQYFEDLPDPTRTSDYIFNLTPEIILKGPKDRIVIKTHIRSNVSTDDSKEKLFVNFNEAYWEYKNYPFRLRLGQNTYSWGSMDGYSPLDVVNSKAFFNPLTPEKLGSPTVDVLWESDTWRLQGLYIIKQPRSILPSTDSRWLPREILTNTQTNLGTILLPDRFDYYYPSTVELNGSRDHNFGFKLSGRMGDFDIAAVHFDGNSSTPQIRPAVTTGSPISLDPPIVQATSNVGLVPVYYRQRTSGLQMIWAPESFIVRFESAYTDVLASEGDIPSWFWQNALGIEKSFAISNKTLTLVAQGHYAKNDDLKDNLISSGARIFDKAFILGARLSLSTQSSMLLTGMYDLDSESLFIHGSYDTKLWQTLDFEISFDLIEGSEYSLLGSYDKNDRVLAFLGYSW